MGTYGSQGSETKFTGLMNMKKKVNFILLFKKVYLTFYVQTYNLCVCVWKYTHVSVDAHSVQRGYGVPWSWNFAGDCNVTENVQLKTELGSSAGAGRTF